MDFLNSSHRHFRPEIIFNFADVSAKTRRFLVGVYSTLFVATSAAVAGAVLESRYRFAGQFSPLAAFGCLIWLMATPDREHNLTMRKGILSAFAFFQGAALNPLLSYAAYVDPSIVPTALAGTAAIFASFSAAALFSNRRSFLYLGGMLSSALSFMFMSSLVSLFFGPSVFSFNVQVYLGLLVFLGFIVFDTQVIVEKAEAGMRDEVSAALTLFVDLVAVFVRIVAILTKNRDEKRKRRD